VAPAILRGPLLNILKESTMMKHTLIGTLVLGLSFALPAAATQMNVSKMKCADFVAVDDQYRPALVYWVAGADHLGVIETDTMVEDTATPIAAIVAECQKTPQMMFKTKVRQMYSSGKLALFDHH
jgi:acid stress chaperone HdeA